MRGANSEAEMDKYMMDAVNTGLDLLGQFLVDINTIAEAIAMHTTKDSDR
jgi:hypothetical protein